jgi:hypothetical protein
MVRTILPVCLALTSLVSCFSAPVREDAAGKTIDTGADAASNAAYIKYVVAPVSGAGETKPVTLENNDMTLVFQADMAFTLQDKKTGKIRAGRTALGITVIRRPNDFDREILRVYLLETDLSKMTAEQFSEKSDLAKTAQIILTPLECTEKMVRYSYEKPADMAGKELLLELQ